jgi:hypothetical protein
MFRVGGGLVSKDGGVRIIGVPGAIKVRWHRHAQQAGKWYIVCEIEAA